MKQCWNIQIEEVLGCSVESRSGNNEVQCILKDFDKGMPLSRARQKNLQDSNLSPNRPKIKEQQEIFWFFGWRASLGLPFQN